MGIPILHFDFLFQAEEASRTFLEEEEEEEGGEKDTRAEGKGCKGEEGGGLVVVSGRKALVRLDDIARRGQLPRLPPRHRALYAPGEGIKRTCHVFPDPPRLRNLSFRRPYCICRRAGSGLYFRIDWVGFGRESDGIRKVLEEKSH